MRTTILAAGIVLTTALSSLACVTQAVIDPMVVPVPLFAGATQSVAVSSDSYVPAGEIHKGDLVTIMGDARVDGEVTGQVVVVLGRLEMNGTARDQVVSVLSDTVIGPEARIGGNLVNVGWLMKREHGSEVGGEVINVSFMQFVPFLDHGHGWTRLLWLFFVWKLIQLAGLFLMVLLVAALVPRRAAQIAAAFPEKWEWALLTGLLAYAGMVIACIILAITLIGIPLAIALGFAVKVTKWLGLASIMFLIGQTIGRNLFKRDLSHLACVMGGFVVYALLSLIPLFGWVFAIVLNMLAVGIALLTKFGADEPWGRGRSLPSPPRPDGRPGSPGPPAPPAPPPVSPGVASGGPPGGAFAGGMGTSPGARPDDGHPNS